MRIIKYKVISLLQIRGFPYSGILFNERQFGAKLKYKCKTPGSQNPDAIICERYIPEEEYGGNINGQFIIVEVGQYNPDKWNKYPVIHIGLNRKVTPMMFVNTNFESETLRAIKEAIDTDIEYSLNGKKLSVLRSLAILAVSGLGLTSKQIFNLYWKDFIEKDGKYICINENNREMLVPISNSCWNYINTYKRSLIKNGLTNIENPRFYEVTTPRMIQRIINDIYDGKLLLTD